MLGKCKIHLVASCSSKNQINTVYIGKDYSDNSIKIEKFDSITIDAHKFICNDPNIDKSAILICRRYLGLSPILFSKLFGYTNHNDIHINRVKSWESGKSSPPKPIQKIIKFIKIYGADNSFVRYLLNDI